MGLVRGDFEGLTTEEKFSEIKRVANMVSSLKQLVGIPPTIINVELEGEEVKRFVLPISVIKDIYFYAPSFKKGEVPSIKLAIAEPSEAYQKVLNFPQKEAAGSISFKEVLEEGGMLEVSFSGTSLILIAILVYISDASKWLKGNVELRQLMVEG